MSTHRTAGPPARIALVIDADAAGRAPVTGFLRLTGWDVTEAAGTRDALRLARRLDPDLVVTDLDRPGP